MRPTGAGSCLTGLVVALALAPLSAHGQEPPARDSAPSPQALAAPVSPFLPTFPIQTAPGPLPPGTRYVFTRDSILWSSSQTLADLLGSVPGVYVAKGGFLGLPEYAYYGGRGAAGVEVYWDGLPLMPLGGDSVYLDLGTVPLTYLRRVDVQVLPATLRVFLISERHEGRDPRSLIRVMSGSFKTAAYTGLFQQRWPSGLGANLAAHFGGTDGASGENRSDQAFDGWVRLEWMPSARAGASYQVRRQTYDRDAVRTGRTPAVVPERIPQRHGARSDYLFSVFAASRPDGLGLVLDAGIGSSAWTNDSIPDDQGVRQAHVGLGYRASTLAAEVRGRVGDSRTTSGVDGRLAWSPVPGIALAGDARYRRHTGTRSSSDVHATAALWRGPLALVGAIAKSEAVQAPALRADTAQETLDRSLRLSFSTRPLGASLGLVERDAYRPLPFAEFPVLPRAGRSSKGSWLVAEGHVQPWKPLTLAGWYQHPRGGTADFQPPAMSRVQATFRSKFWRTFRSGAFDLKVQFALESWDDGTAGLTDAGAPIPLEAVTYQEWHVAFQILDFTAFWDLRDAALAQKQYVPGLSFPPNAQVFGVRWEFSN
ncbi:MAG: TonB-dependent receptor plug domain-containing protein [Gemmatimonadetes bacterium]|nr:TonB-dependent receptor plug domain-containing protein [Gemmatimonadota bacterium]